MLKALLACFLALLNRFISMVRVFCCRDIDVAYEPVANTPRHGDSHGPALVGPGARKATHALVIPPSQEQMHSVVLQAPVPESGPSLDGSTASLPLLRSSLPSATDASANARVPSSDSQAFLPTQQQTLLIMRHGHREDEETPTWHVQAQRPWDPPLSVLGRVQAKEAGVKLAASGTRVDYVVTSPFLRCLQSSAEIVRQLDLPAGKWLINWAMCEIFDPRLLFAGRPEFQPKLVGQPTASWMWSGQSDKQYLAAFMADEEAASKVKIAPSMWCDTMPSLPEKMEAALHRYERAIKSMMVHFEGRNVLVVTHGEAVRAAVNMFQPAALVYEVKHTGHVQLSRSQVAGEWRSWELTSASQATGVSWYA